MNRPTSLVEQASGHPASVWDALALCTIRIAARHAPGDLSGRLEEEWCACLPETGGSVARLRFALGCLWAAAMIPRGPAPVTVPVTSPSAGTIHRTSGGSRGGARWSPRQSAAAEQVICHLNTTPLIDVMLVLIVTLIVSLPSLTHAVKLELARVAAAQQHMRPETIALDIDFDGMVLWNGTKVQGMQALERYYRAEAEKVPLPQIALQPDRRAPYDVVARVLAAAQRNGMTNIGFANTAEFR